MKTDETFVPKAQREVWEWKDSISREVEHLPADQALRKILEAAARAAQELGFAPEQPSMLAESSPEYGRKIKPASGEKK